jgi:hypothetical protein
MRENLVAGSSGLGDDTLELINLRLGTSESTELISIVRGAFDMYKWGNAYPLLRELTGTLILAVTEEFYNTTFVRCESALN